MSLFFRLIFLDDRVVNLKIVIMLFGLNFKILMLVFLMFFKIFDIVVVRFDDKL